jgi:hypothetical protein
VNNFEKFISEQEAKRQIETKKLLDKINYRQDLINEKDKIIKNINYEKELITNDIVELVRNLTSSEISLIWGASSVYYDDAWRYFHYKDEIKDEEKNKKMKNTYNLVLMQIKSKILLEDKNFKLQNIYFYGYDKMCYSFVYKYKKHVFELKIPMFDIANKETYIDMMLGYQILIQTSEHCWSTIICDSNPDVVANKLKEYIKELEIEDDK